MQTHVLQPQQAKGLPLDEVTLAERLKELGYATHLVGKWHLGYSKWAYTPRWRGFDSFFGMYTGASDHYNHRMSTTNNTVPDTGPLKGPIDLRRDEQPVRLKERIHSTTLYANEAVAVMEQHAETRADAAAAASSSDAPPPFFLMLSFQAAHDPIQTPPGWAEINEHIACPRRRQLAGLVSHLDDAIGTVISAAKATVGWSSLLVLYMSDNGGVPYLGSSNSPFRGGKGGLWEGGVSTQLLMGGGALLPSEADVVAALEAIGVPGGLASPSFPGGMNINRLTHITDLFPTILAAAAGEGATFPLPGAAGSSTMPLRRAGKPLDGFNLWPHVVAAARGVIAPHWNWPRDHVLLNIDDVGYPLRPAGPYEPNLRERLRERLRRKLARTLGWADRSAAIRMGRFKLVIGVPGSPYAVSDLNHLGHEYADYLDPGYTQHAADAMAADMAGSMDLASEATIGEWPLPFLFDPDDPSHAFAVEHIWSKLEQSFDDFEGSVWLFDVEKDPHEADNLLYDFLDDQDGTMVADSHHVQIAGGMLNHLAAYKAGAVSPPVNEFGTFSHGWREHVGFFPPRHGGFIAPFEEPDVPLYGSWLAYTTFGTLLTTVLLLLPLICALGGFWAALSSLRSASLPLMRLLAARRQQQRQRAHAD